MNRLYYGDNLDVLRRHVEDESVDLVYLDPPFNSNASYNVLFAEHDGTQAASQIKAFEDTWKWDEGAARAFEAYVAMMAPRLRGLRRVLKPTGCLYLHCDPTASHYLKLLMDAVFGAENFANEIIWRRTTTKNDYKQGAVNWPRVHDVLLMFHRSTVQARKEKRFNQPFSPYADDHVATHYSFKDADGRRYRLSDLTAPGQGSRGHPQYEFLGVTRFWRYNETKMRQLHHEGRIEFRPQGDVPRLKVYLDDAPGVAIGDVWTDVRGMFNFGNEMLGYSTQKPEALLERIVAASSNEGDVVLDPFCGCGTTISAAQKLNRQWIGIDITHLAITLIRSRLTDTFVGKAEYEVIGEPVSVPDATALAAADPYQFQWWALGLVGARPVEQKKGADRGIDGRIYFHVGDGKSRQVILSVKAGKLHANYVRDLRGVLEREKADMGVLISMEDPTGPCGRKPPARASIRRRGASTRACNLSPSRT